MGPMFRTSVCVPRKRRSFSTWDLTRILVALLFLFGGLEFRSHSKAVSSLEYLARSRNSRSLPQTHSIPSPSQQGTNTIPSRDGRSPAGSSGPFFSAIAPWFVQHRIAPLYAELGITPEQARKLEAALERNSASVAALEIASEILQSGTEDERPIFLAAVHAVYDDVDVVCGSQIADKVREALLSTEISDAVERVFADAQQSEPLTTSQASTLRDVLVHACPVSDPEGEQRLLENVNWTETFESATHFLTPVQLHSLELARKRADFARLYRKATGLMIPSRLPGQ